MNIYIVYEINTLNLRPFTVGQALIWEFFLFGAVKLTKNADPDKYKYSSYGIEFDASGKVSLSDGSGFGENVIIFGVDMSSLIYAYW